MNEQYIKTTGEFEIGLSSAGISGDPDKLLYVKDKVTGVRRTALINPDSWFFNWKLKRLTIKLKKTLLILRGDHL
jgi:hypothetical protein